MRLDYNYSEIEMLDRLFGTLYEHHPNKRKHAQQQQTTPSTSTCTAPAVPTGEPGLRPPTPSASASSPRLRHHRKRPLPTPNAGDGGGADGGSETRGPPEREREEEDPLLPPLGLGPSEEQGPSGDGEARRAEKSAQSPPRASDGPRAGEADGTVGGGSKGRRQAQPYS